ncbi:hypothetical protein RE474_08405 [Methanolobus sediminis]|uniref:Uncharacterized protein n=1 Tax=Methanolobus sediminis TaxID=3072978 RepID=A0AA51YKP4_9EURY|nr:hypothetical protein [Methanolobus sediminis]WMW24117.1 hypothetical protein RE474_08405 [Methanolobus sediminis]
MKEQQKSIYKKVSICFILLSLGLMSAQVACAETYTLDEQWDDLSIEGSCVAIDSFDNVYVGSSQTVEYYKYDSNGNLIMDVEINDHVGSIACDSSNNVYLRASYFIYKYDSNGDLITKWKPSGSHFAVDSLGNVYTYYLNSLHTEYNGIKKYDSNGNLISEWYSEGSEDGQIIPRTSGDYIAVDSSDNVYVTDYSNMRIQKFDSNGNFISKLVFEDCHNMAGIAVDSSDNLYVVKADDSIRKYDSTGNLIAECDIKGNGIGIMDVEVDSSGNLYTSGYSVIKKFVLNTQDVGQSEDADQSTEQSQDSDYASEITSDSVTEQTQMSSVESEDGVAETEAATTEDTDNAKSPGFGIVCGIVCLFAAVLYNRR